MLIRRFLASRGALTAMVVLAVVATVVATTSIRTAITPMRSGCAELPDGTGMFLGNAVSQFGVKIGTVEAVEPIAGGSPGQPNKVRMRFSVQADKTFPADVGAVTVADSLVAQRRLELVGAPRQGQPTFDFRSCISNSKTPKTVTESLDALSGVVDQISSAGGQEQFRKAMQALPQLRRSLQGTGPESTQFTERLAELMRDPGPGMSDVAAILDALAPAAGGLATNWAEIEHLLVPFGANLESGFVKLLQAGNVFAPGLTEVLLTLRSVISKYGVFAVPALQIGAPVAEIAANQMPAIVSGLTLVPALQRMFTTVPGAGDGTAISIAYQAGEVGVRVADPEQLCRKVNERSPGECSVRDGQARVDPMTAALALTGAGR